MYLTIVNLIFVFQHKLGTSSTILQTITTDTITTTSEDTKARLLSTDKTERKTVHICKKKPNNNRYEFNLLFG